AGLLAARDSAEAPLFALAFPSEESTAGWERAQAYAVLALAEREEVRGVALFTLAHVPALLGGLSDRRALVAGSSAIALARLGFRASASQCGPWLEREVPHQLVRCGTGVEFHADFSALERPALRALALLSGVALADGEAWRRWWVDNAPGFRARHALFDLPPDAAARLRLDGSEALGPWTLLAPGRVEESARGDVLYLDAATAELLFVFLREQGAFDARHPPSSAGPAQSGVLRVAVGEAEKRFTALAEGEWFHHIGAEIARVRAANAWQRHAPAGQTRLAFWREESERWSQLAADERPRELKRLLLAALRRTRVGAERELDQGELERLFAQPGLAERSDLEPLLGVLAVEEVFGARVERTLALVRLAADAHGADDTTEADPLGRVVTLALERFGDAVVPALRGLAHALPHETLVDLGRDARPAARALSAEALVEGDGPDAEVLRLLLDPAPLVVVTALSALRAHPREAARERLFALVRTDEREVRPLALRALVPLGGKDVLDLAQECLGESDEQLSTAAAWALAELADPRCAPLLGSLLLRGTSSPLYAEARRGLVRLGEVGVLECLRLSRATGARAQREGALLLAEMSRAEAAPALLSLLAQDPRDARVLFELSVLAGQDFQAEQHPETAALEWWDLVVHDDALAWFLAGAERAGLRAPPREAFGANGTLEGARFLLAVAAMDAPHLVERAWRELEHVLGRPLARVGAEARAEALAALRDELERRFAR
ncbi:MAG: HEAT repeat domain-containing protein, partial [Planctomycetota bacterium]